MVIEDLNDVFVEPQLQEIEIYSLDKNKTVYTGPLDQADEFFDEEVATIDNLNGGFVLTINI